MLLKDSDAVVMLFVKKPEDGYVKTRLASKIGGRQAVELYKGFVLDVLQAVTVTGLNYKICFAPEDARAFFIDWLGVNHLIPQTGEDLGARMSNAFRHAFEMNYGRAIVIGSDIPDISPADIKNAVSVLSDHRAVIGPAEDGGYYLIGFRRDAFLPWVFRGIKWGTDAVFRQTMSAFFDLGEAPYVLPARRDIDNFLDLMAYAKKIYQNPDSRSHTMKIIDSLPALAEHIKNFASEKKMPQ